MEETSSMVMDKAAFAAYRELRRIADYYKIDVEPPRIVFVGETSTGKSMLVQNFLGFPCTFTSTGVATRCPVAYQLRYNPHAKVRRVLKPQGVETKDLAAHIGQHMKKVEKECTFSHEPYCVEIESNSYPDLEILDIPGLVAGQGDSSVRDAVEKSKLVFFLQRIKQMKYSSYILCLKSKAILIYFSHGILCTQSEIHHRITGRCQSRIGQLLWRSND